MTPERFQKIKKILNQREKDLTLILDNVNKPHNLAAMIRTCDAIGIGKIHAKSKNKTIGLNLKAASGSNLWVKVKIHNKLTNLYKKLKRCNHNIFVANNTSSAIDFRQVDYTNPSAIVMGAELGGISKETLKYATKEIKIPLNGMVESLNVSVASAVILFEARRQRELKNKHKKKPKSLEDNNLLFELCYPELSDILRQKGEAYPDLDEKGEIVY
tara:strand:- start:994 stop:1638 length:645 start_codon:yes stop_codon:yes gene_type:complete